MKIKLEKPIPYNVYWSSQGEYGKIRVARMLRRKEARHWKRSSRRRRGFQCEMGYGDCERRGYCNGDC